jgi:SAM-dependent methyltransferase
VRSGADLYGIPILHERCTGECDGWLFDPELDDWVKAKIARERTLAGTCNVAGAADTFELRGTSFRESLIAEGSGSSARVRAVAAVLSWAVFGDPFSSVPSVCRELMLRRSRIYLAETSGTLHGALQRGLGDLLTTSEYFGPEHESGAVVDGRRHEDLRRLSFEDGRFDAVITMDVMEHVSHAPTAEREIVRVLRPGGWYIFTIPFYFTLEHDRIRALEEPDGTIVHLEAAEYHGDPVRPESGVLVFRDFSEADLRARFTALGCTFEIMRVWSRWLGILGSDMVVFVVQRAASAEVPRR